MKQITYTRADIDKLFWATRKIINVIEKCPLRETHRVLARNAEQQFSKTFIRIANKKR